MIGIDVGGANLKVVDDTGVHLYYCPLWQEAPISDLLRPHAGQEAAVVMSGELADCFSSRMEGISFIVDQVRAVFPTARFYGMDGKFHPGAVPELAAANWLSMADHLRREYPDAVLVDMGSTTTDIIPLNAFSLMVGQTDLTRLQQGYMVYCGLLRTNVATLVRSVPVGGILTPVSTEFFASTGDAYVALGLIRPENFTTETADRKGTGRADCIRRLARMVCADPEEIGEAGVLDIAREVVRTQQDLVRDSVVSCTHRHGAKEVIVAGIGSHLVSGWVGGRDLADIVGPYADALPAWAVRKVAERTG